MSRLYMLDTNTVSYILKGKSPAARARLASLGPDEVACISIVTELELEFGLAKNPNADALRRALRWFLARIQVLTLGSAEARAYGQLRAQQETAGRPLESMDMIIAAHAIAVGATMVTADKVFDYVPGLAAKENWASDLNK
ncbi:MAG TPA: type II toxin-antitoxin system VapC family toxin [Terracidiphilus sp.]|nr:type II toxin-antitoxin system VapC family toxin [Terracidiphilus sp.]